MPRATSAAATVLRFRAFLPALILMILIGILTVAGGASRADVSGQLIVAVAAPLALLAALFSGATVRSTGLRMPTVILLAAAAIVAIQLVPVPSGLWLALPGHAIFSDLPGLLGAAPWRPIALVPDAALLALASLIVPAACLYLVWTTPAERMRWVLMALLGSVLFSAVLGVLQFSSSGWENPLVNASVGAPSGSFANRNHQALFLSLGIVLVTMWFLTGRRALVEAATTLALIALLALSILATGSRAGLLVGSLGLLASATLAIGAVRHRRPAISRAAISWMLTATIGSIALLAVTAVVSNRAQSVERLTGLDASSDFRARALPTVISAIGEFLPVGSGFGSFDAVFRMNEPDTLLKLSYFNHAHDDFLEIVLEGGAPAAALLGLALMWIAYASFLAWRRPFDSAGVVARGASAIIILISIASVVDYPVRTPLIMAVLTIASCWLAAPEQWWPTTGAGKLYRRSFSG